MWRGTMKLYYAEGSNHGKISRIYCHMTESKMQKSVYTPFYLYLYKKHEGDIPEGERGEKVDGTWVGMEFLSVYLFP